jgi:uncharacterized protein
LKNLLTTQTYELSGPVVYGPAEEAAAMIVRVSELEESGLRIEGVEAFAGAFSDPSWRLDAASLEVVPDGAEVFVRGRVAATVPLTCSRCVEAFDATVAADIDVRLVPRVAGADSTELGADDLDVDFYENDQIDLGHLIDNETALALPMKPLCRPDCKGLCVVCGANRNVVACTCAQRPPDPRLAALRGLAARQPH